MNYSLKQTGVVLFLALTASLLTGCNKQRTNENAPEPRPVKMYKVGSDGVPRSSRYPGNVSPVNQSALAFEVPGQVTVINVKQGQVVSEGQILAKLDARDYQAQFESAKANRDTALADVRRYEKAFKANAVTAQTLEQARLNLQVAESNYSQAKKALEETTLRAPFEGRIARKHVQVFDTVGANQPVFQLHGDSEFEMVVDVPEAAWATGDRVNSPEEIDLNNQLFVTVSAVPGKRYPGKITEFSGSADPITRTYEVKVGFPVPENSIISSGMTGHVLYIPKSSKSAVTLSIPIDAVVGGQENKAFVWLFDASNGVVIKQNVTLGEVSSDRVIVHSGLSKGDRIAISGVHSLFEGSPVYPLEDSME